MPIVRNERGEKWYVVRGDPGWNGVRVLSKAGYGDIVLYEKTIMTGEPHTPPAAGELEAIANAYEQLSGKEEQAVIAAHFLLMCRLWDCTSFLAASQV